MINGGYWFVKYNPLGSLNLESLMWYEPFSKQSIKSKCTVSTVSGILV